MKAVNIDWDVDLDEDRAHLPTEIEIPAGMEEEEDISDYLTDVTGFCHKGYQLVEYRKDHEEAVPLQEDGKSMKRIEVVLNVDEEIILNESGQESLEDAIAQELGWLHDSGLSVESWSFAEPELNREQRLVNELLNYFAEHHDSSELYRILHGDLEMSHEDIELLGFDLSQCYESKGSQAIACNGVPIFDGYGGVLTTEDAARLESMWEKSENYKRNHISTLNDSSKAPLKQRIQSASNRAEAAHSVAQQPEKGPLPER